jgi:hypothetical protein
MDVVLEQLQADGTWKGRKLVNSAKDYELFREFGWLGIEDGARVQRWSDEHDRFVDVASLIEPRGLPDGFDYSVIDDDDGEELGHTVGWLSAVEFAQAVGRCMAKRGAISQEFPAAIQALDDLNWPEPTQARLVFWFD